MSVFLSAVIIPHTKAARLCLSKFILKAYNMEGLKSLGMLLALSLVPAGCILCQQTGNNVPVIAY